VHQSWRASIVIIPSCRAERSEATGGRQDECGVDHNRAGRARGSDDTGGCGRDRVPSRRRSGTRRRGFHSRRRTRCPRAASRSSGGLQEATRCARGCCRRPSPPLPRITGSTEPQTSTRPWAPSATCSTTAGRSPSGKKAGSTLSAGGSGAWPSSAPRPTMSEREGRVRYTATNPRFKKTWSRSPGQNRAPPPGASPRGVTSAAAGMVTRPGRPLPGRDLHPLERRTFHGAPRPLQPRLFSSPATNPSSPGGRPARR